jgi:transposase
VSDEERASGELFTGAMASIGLLQATDGASPMRRRKQHSKPVNDLSRSLIPLDPNHTLIAGMVPGVERQPLKKLEPEASKLLTLLDRWRMEAEKAGHKVKRGQVPVHSWHHVIPTRRSPMPFLTGSCTRPIASPSRESLARPSREGPEESAVVADLTGTTRE